jgi:acyl-CoA synthetase (NDP forming)
MYSATSSSRAGVIGASKPGKAGNEILVNMLANGYQGKFSH